MLLDRIKRVYFIGIGGIGMSALARFFHKIGKAVAGYDRTMTPLTFELEKEGISVHYADDPAMIPFAFITHPAEPETLIIFTPAIPPDSLELSCFREKGYIIHKRSEILGIITAAYKTIAVAGTHGKSTVSAMITQVLVESGTGCTAFLGAISKSLNSNLVLSETSEFAVAEADEFDRSFLKLNPFLSVVTSMDPDHLDIYGDYAGMTEGFRQFVNRTAAKSSVLIKDGLPLVPDPDKGIRTWSYSLDSPFSDFHASNIVQKDLGYQFDLVMPYLTINKLTTVVPGITNVENAVAAASTCHLAGMTEDAIRNGLACFTGLVRRFDIRFNKGGVIYIDDYAHHPNEIKALISSVRLLFPDRKITGIFQPHLFTRTRDLVDEFAEELANLDELILLEIYPARELPIPGVDSGLIYNKIKGITKSRASKTDLPELLKDCKLQVLLTIGAGDIDQLCPAIVKFLNDHVA